VIKKPIDLEKIGQKVKASNYENLDELLSDLVLMFDNACRYNEPDSQIYKVSAVRRFIDRHTCISFMEISIKCVSMISFLVLMSWNSKNDSFADRTR